MCVKMWESGERRHAIVRPRGFGRTQMCRVAVIAVSVAPSARPTVQEQCRRPVLRQHRRCQSAGTHLLAPPIKKTRPT